MVLLWFSSSFQDLKCSERKRLWKEGRLPEDVTHKEEYEKEEKNDLSDGQWAFMWSIWSHVEEYKEVEVRKETKKVYEDVPGLGRVRGGVRRQRAKEMNEEGTQIRETFVYEIEKQMPNF